MCGHLDALLRLYVSRPAREHRNPQFTSPSRWDSQTLVGIYPTGQQRSVQLTPDFSNGIHLNVIEAADDPAAESWTNLRAIDDLVRDVVETDSHLVISALGGDAGAGGVPLALAADYVVGREDVVLNPYYQHMGGLYGSEYWTYLLPRRVGPTATARLTGAPFQPVGAFEAVRTGLLDAAFGADLAEFRACTARLAERIAHDGLHHARLQDKRRRRALDEQTATRHRLPRSQTVTREGGISVGLGLRGLVSRRACAAAA
jgi:enoyl-CoA hydratase/carnithine racemase